VFAWLEQNRASGFVEEAGGHVDAWRCALLVLARDPRQGNGLVVRSSAVCRTFARLGFPPLRTPRPERSAVWGPVLRSRGDVVRSGQF
jgi:hypothetical protein